MTAPEPKVVQVEAVLRQAKAEPSPLEVEWQADRDRVAAQLEAELQEHPFR